MRDRAMSIWMEACCASSLPNVLRDVTLRSTGIAPCDIHLVPLLPFDALLCIYFDGLITGLAGQPHALGNSGATEAEQRQRDDRRND